MCGSRGCNTLVLKQDGGAAGNALLRYDGKQFPSNPTVAPAQTTAIFDTELIGAEPELTELAGDQASGE
ncbi:MAG: hypothetical protein DI637_11115 [Citromicrobium sp.]|nr:MAG: hypothetical protein DI637_11115 [Citromicrobium sp.]